MTQRTPKTPDRVPVLFGVSSVDFVTPVAWAIDPVTGRGLVDVQTSITLQTDIFTSTNLQTTFTPSKTPVSTIYLSINGSIQTPSTDYSLTGGNYVLTNGIPAGNAVVIVYTY